MVFPLNHIATLNFNEQKKLAPYKAKQLQIVYGKYLLYIMHIKLKKLFKFNHLCGFSKFITTFAIFISSVWF